MTDSLSPADRAAAAPDDRRARRNVAVLVAAQAVLGSQVVMVFVVGGLAGQMLTPVPCLATLPISMIVLGAALAAPALAGFMARHGRRAGFFLGAGGGLAGSALAAWGLAAGSFGLFLGGSFLTGLYMAAQGFYRFAAADTASEAFRPKAISWVMAGGLISAVLGPQLVKATTGLFAVPFLGTYLVALAINLAGMALYLLLDLPRPVGRREAAVRGPSWGALLARPPVLVAVVCGMVSYALMNLVMTSTPLAIVGCGFSAGDAADVISAHVLAMFVPSFFTGHLIARWGAERVVLAGLVILAGAGATGLSGVELGHFFVGLILLGLGWNFGFIGATAMLTAAAGRPEERHRAQGMNDALVMGGVTVASLASGGLMNCVGGSAVEGWQAVNLAMAPFLVLAGGALIWLWLRPRDA
ncbi:MFS transporter [Rubellimicrobium sp. CFH 75288]|uniref:MFS transporter n=1 Tax=Rubellimicrobium sp. CFH 75288 TaxID=2697034 RepID=UPI001412872D|nr:MFS transporter [Rubellimicrobium sp. CFH 75288]NAZ35218.1 MFS transporter [Rubellimicrobium sp. CFH 75288]